MPEAEQGITPMPDVAPIDEQDAEASYETDEEAPDVDESDTPDDETDEEDGS